MLGTSSRTLGQSLLGEQTLGATVRLCQAKRTAQSGKATGHSISAKATFAQNSHGEKAESGPYSQALAQPWEGESNLNSSMTRSVRQDPVSSAGTPFGPQHSREHLRVSLGNVWL